MRELKIRPRDYQKNIFNSCKDRNCLVILPTGTGKTLIAIMLAVERFKKFPLRKILMLAPTRPLVEQHFESFKKALPDGWADMQIFTGKINREKRKQIYQTAEFIFSTPQCIANDLERNLYDLRDVSLLIIDECHRCLKNYAYNKVAQKYREQASEQRILGLTASPGSDKKTISSLCENLGIENVEIRTRESKDVKPYLQELEFKKIEVEFPPELEEIRVLLQELFNKKINELKNRGFAPNSTTKMSLLELQSKLMSGIGKDYNRMLAISACSVALKISHALELLETQTISSFVSYLKDLYKQARNKESRGVQRLVKEPGFTRAYSLALGLEREHPKIYLLKALIKRQFFKDKNSKVIVFAQFRETVRIIRKFLNEIEGVKAEVFVGQAIKDHGGSKTGLRQKEQKEIIEKFKHGKINVLVSTSIGEEGLDIPEVNEVIFYEPVPSAIRKIQRAGRTARLNRGSLKILVTRNTRDQAYHYSAFRKEKRMRRAIGEIKKSFKSNPKAEGNKNIGEFME